MSRVLQVVLNAEGTVGGEQRHVSQILDALSASGVDASVVTWGVPAFVEELRERGVPAVEVDSRRILDPALVRRIQSVVEEGRFDIVHAHGHRAGLLGRVAALRAGCRHVIWTCHLAENKAEGNPVVAAGYRAALQWLQGRTDATVAVSPHLREWLATQGIDPSQVLVVPNGVDVGMFAPGPVAPGLVDELGLRRESPTVVCVARLTPQKGVETLVRASGLLAARGRALQVLVVGAGPLEASLRTLARDLGAPVVFAGERSDIPDVLRLADAVVVPSLWEGAFCYTVLEALASEKPLVCSDIRIFADAIGDSGVARTFRVQDHESLARAIAGVLDEAAAAGDMARRGRDFVVRRYSVESMQAAMMDLYGRVLEEAS